MEIDFSKGLTVFTGETGVGKSILLDALSFGVGFKNKNNILKSEDKDGEIITEFIIKKNKKLKDLLTDSGFTFEENLLLRRVIQKKNKRIKTFINDKNCSQDFLKKVSNKLLDIQNQNDSQGLFDSNNGSNMVLAQTINRELWNGSLNVLSNYSIKNADSNGGYIETDWIYEKNNTSNRCLIKVQVTSLELVSNGVEANIICQELINKKWINDNQDYINENKQLTLAILTAANKYKTQNQ